MAIGSSLITGLPSLPNDELPPNLYGAFLSIHTAIKNLADQVAQLTGIDGLDPSEYPTGANGSTVLTGNATRFYPVAAVAINPGQLVNLYDSGGGVLKARLASASSAATFAHGVANETGVVGQQFEMQWLRGRITSIGAMNPGTLYYLSPTPGATQNVAPVAAGTIRQPIGLAIAASIMLMDIPLSYHLN